MRYLTVEEVLALHSRIIASSWQPRRAGTKCTLLRCCVTSGDIRRGRLYTTLARKAAALGHSLISNHPFIDGNKRIGSCRYGSNASIEW